MPSADGQVNFIGAVGPTVFDVENPVADLAITKSNNTATVVPGEDISYEILVENLGPLDVVGATVEDTFPSVLQNPIYTSTTTGTVSGNTASGTGNINDTVDITVGSTLTYLVTGSVDPSVTTTISNTATVAVPEGVTDPDPDNNADSEEDTPTPQVDLRIEKSNGVTEVRPGDTLTYTITITNQGPSDVLGATVSDIFPSELTGVSFSSTVVSGTVSGNSASGTGNIADTVNMAAGSVLRYTVTATVADSAMDELANTATVAVPDGTTELDPSDNTSTDTDIVVDEVDLVITKSDGATTAIPGQSVTYEIVVQNLGPRGATGAVVSDTFPALLSGVTFSSSATGGASGNTASGSGNLSETVTLPANSSITYLVTGTIDPSAVGNLVNTATVTAPPDVVDTNPANNSATDTDTLIPNVDLAVTKSNGVTSVEPNDVLTYEITVTNSGPSDVVGAQLQDTFPSGLIGINYTSTAQGGASGNTATGTGNLNETLDLPPGSSITYLVNATVSESATTDILNTVTVAAPEGTVETNPDNNSASDLDTLIPGVDLSITKTNNTDRVFAGGTTTYTIVVRNSGPNPVTGAQVTDLFPVELVTVSYTSVATNGASGNTNGSGNINDTVSMPVGSTITYTAQASIDPNATGQLVNQAMVTAPDNVVDLNPDNMSATDADAIDILLSEISGFVYVDLDNDGVFDANEPPIPGVEILLEQNGAQINQTVTNANGAYDFTDLVAGVYDVQEIQPANFRNGKTTVGGGVGTVVGPDRIRVALSPGVNANELNFGELYEQPSKRELLASAFRTT